MLTLHIAIVTRNRAQVLDLSLPLLLKQSRKPNVIIIVDSSDDPEAIANVVAAHSAATDVPIMFIQSDAGTSLQRNIALKHVKSDIVMFPDDDALLLPGALQAIMRIYEADIDERIGGVCGREVLEAPAGIMSATRKSHEMTRLDKLKLKISRVRWRIEKRLCPDPFIVHGRFRNAELGKINWLKEVNAVPVEFMNGFRMSFRTRLITKHGFDEALGRYALFEDIDASFSIMKTYHVVAALGAEIFHYKSSKKRDCGTVLGVTQILSRSYVVHKHAEPDAPARRILKRYSLYKIVIYATEAKTSFGRDRLTGALRAYRKLPIILRTELNDLKFRYFLAKEACLDDK